MCRLFGFQNGTLRTHATKVREVTQRLFRDKSQDCTVVVMKGNKSHGRVCVRCMAAISGQLRDSWTQVGYMYTYKYKVQ